jgi:predicted transcriptional regulator
MRTKHTFRLPPDLAGKLSDYAARMGAPQSLVVEAALASHLSPDGADRVEAALARRLDRMSRQIERLERHVDISNEALALFVRFWLTRHAALLEAAQPAAQAKGRERYQGFVEALGRRLARGRKLADEIIRDLSADEAQQNSDGGTS